MKTMHVCSTIFIVAALSIASIAPAQSSVADHVSQTIASNTHVLELSEDGLSGSGGDMLLREAADVSFLCIGESHLNNETPELVAAMLPALRDAGYTAFAIETGERIAGRMQDAFERGAGDEMARLFAETPFTAAFVDHQAEFDLAGQAVGLGFDLWGLDQAFLGSARFNLGELVRLAETDEQREAAQAQLDRAQAGFERFITTGDQSAGFLTSSGPETYKALRESFVGNAEALRIIDELEASGRIYQLYGAGQNYKSNYERISLMKQHLSERVRQLAEGEKVLMKFGTMHMGRGYSDLNQLDLGNAASELGALRGGGSLNVYVMAGASRNGETVRDFTETSAALRELIAAMGDAEWAVVDLRALRPVFHRTSNREGFEELSELVWGFDLAVVTKEFTRAQPLAGVPSPPGQ